MQLHIAHLAFGNLHGNVLEERNEVQFVQHLFVVFDVRVALGRAIVVVEGHARGHHVDHRQPIVRDGGLQQRLELLLVAAKGPGHESRPPLERQGAAIERRQLIGRARLQG